MWNHFTMRHFSFYSHSNPFFKLVFICILHFKVSSVYGCISLLYVYVWTYRKVFQSICSIIHDWYLVSILEVSVWLPPTENKKVSSLALIVAAQIWFLSAYLRCVYICLCVWMCLLMSRQMQSSKCQVDHLPWIVLH